jgi:hypothetical protein
MLTAGLDPNDHGYSLDAETFDDVRDGFESGEWVLGQDERLMWEDIQKHVPRNRDWRYENTEEFFDWVLEAEFSDFVGQSHPPTKTRLVHTAYRNAPDWAFNAVYPLYRTIKSRRRRQRIGGEDWIDWRIETIEPDDEY